MTRFVAFAMIVLMVCAFPMDGQAKSRKNSTAGNPKYASMVIDAQTGAILSERYPDKSVHPASLTKVMTLLLLFEAMENGNVRLNDKITISKHAASQAPSKIGLAPGATIRVEDAILAMVTKSANDISVAVAEHLGGSESRFAERMTYRAHSIGMNRTTYRNAHGLHNPAQVTTARDQATLARYVITRYPNYYRYFSTKQFTYRGKTYTNHNRLMQTYPGMDGFKTGFINASGFNLIASAKKDGRRIIGVVFGGRSWKTRNDHMAELLNTGWGKMNDMRYANAPVKPVAGPAPTSVVAQTPVIAAPPLKPVFKAGNIPSAAPQGREQAQAAPFTSLGSLNNTGTAVIVEPGKTAVSATPPDVTGDAIQTVRNAMNNGEYSEVTGQGDYDAGTARRVETGLLAAAVYKGENRYLKQNVAAVPPLPAGAIVLDPARTLQVPPQKQAYIEPVSIPSQIQPAPQPADLWSVQIGAYTSRVATDDALRLAHGKLPGTLTHAQAMVVPLKTAEGILFRARLGNLSQAQANEACRYFRDCLPVAPR